jgi:hypothetical protein
MLKYKSFCRFLKRKHPNLSIQRRKCPNDCWGMYLDNKIIISNGIKNQDFSISILIHELAHHLAADKEKGDHDKWFGKGYYLAYNLFLEWLEDTRY